MAERFLYTVHSKKNGTVEVRAFVKLRTHFHRMGTMNMPEQVWVSMRVTLNDGEALINEDKWTPFGRTLGKPSFPEIPR